MIFAISPEIVAAFARLTGDVSSLHVDETFARRSLYRANVAHGMLPVLSVALDPNLPREGKKARLERLAGSFLKPVFLSDRLNVEFTSERTDDDRLESRCEIAKEDTGEVVTRCVATWRYIDAKSIEETASLTAPHLVQSKIEENDLGFEMIERGRTASFRYQFASGHGNAIAQILEQTTGSGQLTHCLGSVDLEQLALAGLCSTLVGVCMPGRSATFLGFDLNFPEKSPGGKACLAESVVSFVSASTRTIVEKASFSAESGESMAQGKLKVKVNDRPSAMPSMAALKSHGIELGLQGKVALVTGASRGIGETTAKLLSLHGAKVIVNFYSGEKDARRIVEEIAAAGGEAIALQGDVSDAEAVERLVEQATKTFGPIEILVNNAVRGFTATPFLNLSWNETQKDLEVVLHGAINCCQAVLPKMIARKSGKIVNLGTIAIDLPPPEQASYVVAKSGLLGLTRSLAVEFAAHNIQVNMVSPSMAETDLTAGISAMAKGQIAAQSPTGRLVDPIEVASAIAFLLSPLSNYTTGQRIVIGGGSPPFL